MIEMSVVGVVVADSRGLTHGQVRRRFRCMRLHQMLLGRLVFRMIRRRMLGLLPVTAILFLRVVLHCVKSLVLLSFVALGCR